MIDAMGIAFETETQLAKQKADAFLEQLGKDLRAKRVFQELPLRRRGLWKLRKGRLMPALWLRGLGKRQWVVEQRVGGGRR